MPSREQRLHTAAVAFACAALMALTGCSVFSGPGLPAITAEPTGETLVGKFVWFDLLTEDVEASRDFYAALFGWEFDDSQGPKGYSVIRNQGRPIAGMALIDDEIDAPESIWLASLSVADVDRAARVTTKMGGEVIDGPVDVWGRGRVAVLRDPTGATLIALRSTSGDPPDGETSVGSWVWADLVTDDAKKASAFYEELVGYRVQEVEEKDGSVFHVLGRSGQARAGVVEVDWEEVESNWLPYVSVEDVDAVAKHARTLGGQQLLRVDRAAVLTDPTGAAFGVHQIKKGGR